LINQSIEHVNNAAVGNRGTFSVRGGQGVSAKTNYSYTHPHFSVLCVTDHWPKAQCKDGGLGQEVWPYESLRDNKWRSNAITKNAASAKNGFLKLVGSGIISFMLNLAAGLVCWWLVGA
jgi:hypothetical protein